MKKTFLYVMAVLCLFCYELAIAPLLPWGLDQVNLWLVVVVFVAVAFKFYQGVVFGLIGAGLLDLYSVLPFGAIMIATGITLTVVYIVYRRFLTNMSLYATLMLTALATAMYSVLLFCYTAVMYFGETHDPALIYRLGLAAGGDLLQQIALHLICTLILFVVFHASSRRFSAAFIDTVKT